jgi:hypothetical protein
MLSLAFLFFGILALISSWHVLALPAVCVLCETVIVAVDPTSPREQSLHRCETLFTALGEQKECQYLLNLPSVDVVSCRLP